MVGVDTDPAWRTQRIGERRSARRLAGIRGERGREDQGAAGRRSRTGMGGDESGGTPASCVSRTAVSFQGLPQQAPAKCRDNEAENAWTSRGKGCGTRPLYQEVRALPHKKDHGGASRVWQGGEKHAGCSAGIMPTHPSTPLAALPEMVTAIKGSTAPRPVQSFPALCSGRKISAPHNAAEAGIGRQPGPHGELARRFNSARMRRIIQAQIPDSSR